MMGVAVWRVLHPEPVKRAKIGKCGKWCGGTRKPVLVPWPMMVSDSGEIRPVEIPAIKKDDIDLEAFYRDAMARLPVRWAYVLDERMNGTRLEALGRMMGVTKERVRQIEIAALTRLRLIYKREVGLF
jgi:hypothetical protein